jgi:hypothetical protein
VESGITRKKEKKEKEEVSIGRIPLDERSGIKGRASKEGRGRD